jgi:hypothetical protein
MIVLSFDVVASLNVHDGLLTAAGGYVSSEWSEGPLALQLHRISLGQPAYTSPLLANSYDYGPVYLFALTGLRAVFAPKADVATYRILSMAIGLVASLPLSFAAVAIARRAGLRATHRAATLACIAGAASMGAAILSQSVTFPRLHPDDLTFTLVAAALAVHFAIAERRLPPESVWLLVAACVLATFTKQNTAAVAPVLLAGLAASGAISWRLFAVAACTTALVVIAVVVLMPADMRAWSVFVPLAHRYAFTAARLDALWYSFTYRTPYLSLLLVATIPMLVVVRKRMGDRALWVDAAAVAAVATAAFSAFFKQFGIWNNLTVLAAATVPYAAALLGLLLAPEAYVRSHRAFVGVATLITIVLALSIVSAGDYVTRFHGQWDPRPTAALERRLCDTGRSILLTQMFEEFLKCPTATFALEASYLELRVAYPRYYAGPTIFDRPPDAHYVVVSGIQPLPWAWLPYYRMLSLPVTPRLSGGSRLNLRVYERL